MAWLKQIIVATQIVHILEHHMIETYYNNQHKLHIHPRTSLHGFQLNDHILKLYT